MFLYRPKQKKRAKRSIAWNFFATHSSKKNPGKQVNACLVKGCGFETAVNGGTSNMLDHLKRSHSHELNAAEDGLNVTVSASSSSDLDVEDTAQSSNDAAE